MWLKTVWVKLKMIFFTKNCIKHIWNPPLFFFLSFMVILTVSLREPNLKNGYTIFTHSMIWTVESSPHVPQITYNIWLNHQRSYPHVSTDRQSCEDNPGPRYIKLVTLKLYNFFWKDVPTLCLYKHSHCQPCRLWSPLNTSLCKKIVIKLKSFM